MESVNTYEQIYKAFFTYLAGIFNAIELMNSKCVVPLPMAKAIATSGLEEDTFKEERMV